MLIPNSTQIPNIIIRQWMKNLSDTALRVVLIIADQTYGWIEDPETKTRKKTDWISYSQLMERSGRQKAAVSTALRELEKLGYIEIMDAQSNRLTTLEERRGRRLFYRIKTSSESEQVTHDDTDSNSKNHLASNMFEKRSSESEHTKDTYTKAITNVIGENLPDDNNLYKKNHDIQEGIDKLRFLTGGRIVREQQNRYALQRLYRDRGKDRVLRAIVFAYKSMHVDKYCPTIKNYLDLEEKWVQLERYARQKREEAPANYGYKKVQ